MSEVNSFLSLIGVEIGNIPGWLVLSFNVLLAALGIAFVSVFIYLFYKLTSKRDIIPLNLKQYNSLEHEFFRKVLAVAFYFVEYLIFMPLVILISYVMLSVVMLILASDTNTGQILMLSAATILAIRFLAYYHSEISREVAKLLPFMALSVFILSPGAFNSQAFSAKLLALPSLLTEIVSFFGVVIVVEIVLRGVYAVSEFVKSE